MHYSTQLLRDTRKAIGQNIRDQRLKKRMTLKKLSRLTGIPVDLLDQYELGKNEIGLEEILRVGCILHIKS